MERHISTFPFPWGSFGLQQPCRPLALGRRGGTERLPSRESSGLPSSSTLGSGKPTSQFQDDPALLRATTPREEEAPGTRARSFSYPAPTKPFAAGSMPALFTRKSIQSCTNAHQSSAADSTEHRGCQPEHHHIKSLHELFQKHSQNSFLAKAFGLSENSLRRQEISPSRRCLSPTCT